MLLIIVCSNWKNRFLIFCGPWYKEKKMLDECFKESFLIFVSLLLVMWCTRKVQKLRVIFFLHCFVASKLCISYAKKLIFCASFRVLLTLFLWSIPVLVVEEKANTLWKCAVAALYLGNMGGKKYSYFWGEKLKKGGIEFFFLLHFGLQFLRNFKIHHFSSSI